VFQSLSRLHEDGILGLMAKFRADPSPRKIDLGVGVYRDADGHTPVLDCVRRAEQAVLAAQTTKSYVAAAGRAEFNEAVTDFVLGAAHPAVRDGRSIAVQAPGGCGALRLGAELIRAAAPAVSIHISDPTWGNHAPLLGGSGLALLRYPYYDATARRLRFDAMLEHLSAAAAGDVVLIHACCHNPCGADLALDQWRALIEILERRRLLPFLDLAYQGFGEDAEADVAGLRLVAQSVPECLIATSFSKNLGLYRERVGALLAIGEGAVHAAAVKSHVLQIARGIYSMPPDHGAAIAAHIFADAELRRSWMTELAAMRGRIHAMRVLLAQSLREARADDAFGFLTGQRGLFSLLGATPAAVERLRQEHHVYMTADSRMNLAGVTPHNVAYLGDAICRILG